MEIVILKHKNLKKILNVNMDVYEERAKNVLSDFLEYHDYPPKEIKLTLCSKSYIYLQFVSKEPEMDLFYYDFIGIGE